MTIVHLEKEAPGICVEYGAEDQASLLLFVRNVVDELSKLPLGRELLAEFAPGGGKPHLGLSHFNCTVVIAAPTAVSASTTAVMQTLSAPTHKFGAQAVEAKRKAQRILAWWPGSENTSLRKGMKVLPPEWTKKSIDMTTVIGAKKRKEPKFYYHGRKETFSIALIHELIHAYHGLTGQEHDDGGQEESQTVGLFANFNRKYTENKFRAAMDMPMRSDYKGLPGLGVDVNVVKNLQPLCERPLRLKSPK